MIYRALSVIDPAGRLIREGRKTIEVRQWGPGLELPLCDLLIVQNKKRLGSSAISFDPDGLAMAMVDVVAIRPWHKDELNASCSTAFEEGWLAWELRNIRPFDYSLSVPARLRIYEVDLDPGRCSFSNPRC
jgi:hypothetical protein